MGDPSGSWWYEPGCPAGTGRQKSGIPTASCLKVVMVSHHGEAKGHSRVSASVAMDIIELFTEGGMRGLRRAGPEHFRCVNFGMPMRLPGVFQLGFSDRVEAGRNLVGT